MTRLREDHGSLSQTFHNEIKRRAGARSRQDSTVCSGNEAKLTKTIGRAQGSGFISAFVDAKGAAAFPEAPA